MIKIIHNVNNNDVGKIDDDMFMDAGCITEKSYAILKLKISRNYL